MVQEIDKLQNYADHLLGRFLGLKEIYAFLHPMLFDKEIVEKYGSGRKHRGFAVIKHSLYVGCVQDVANLANDNDKRSPSKRSIMTRLGEQRIIDLLRTNYTNWAYPECENESEEMRAAIDNIHKKEEQARRDHFDSRLDGLKAKWDSYQREPHFNAFQTIRDKLTAHLELKLIEGEYKHIDVGELGVKWGDLSTSIRLLERIVLDINELIRCAGFAMDSLETPLEHSVREYWS